MTQQILVCFGGISAEHEVSIITGLQVLEQIDRKIFKPIAMYIDKKGGMYIIPNLKNRHDFKRLDKAEISIGIDNKGGYIQINKILTKKIYPDCAYLAFHGGTGESGPVQGLLETLQIPYTSTSQESAVITMNKALTKTILQSYGIPTVEGMSITSSEIVIDSQATAKRIISKLNLPVIVKPAHLGSSIGIQVARSEIELEKALLAGSYMDTEIVVERFLEEFVEYNCAVRTSAGTIQTSEIEKPLNHDEVLSFADKYERGGKKTGSGMASLQRELPADITETLENEIKSTAIKTYQACRCKGMIRIDFLYCGGQLFVNEINPIPGSMAFYLWEAKGIPFRQQITDAINQAIIDYSAKQSLNLEYTTSIVDAFIAE